MKDQDGVRILLLNTEIRYLEYLCHVFNTGSADITLGKIRENFVKKYKTSHEFSAQEFMKIRLILLLLINEEKGDFDEDTKNRIRRIRNAVAHGNFITNKKGFIFYDYNFEFLPFSKWEEKIKLENFFTIYLTIKNDKLLYKIKKKPKSKSNSEKYSGEIPLKNLVEQSSEQIKKLFLTENKPKIFLTENKPKILNIISNNEHIKSPSFVEYTYNELNSFSYRIENKFQEDNAEEIKSNFYYETGARSIWEKF